MSIGFHVGLGDGDTGGGSFRTKIQVFPGSKGPDDYYAARDSGSWTSPFYRGIAKKPQDSSIPGRVGSYRRPGFAPVDHSFDDVPWVAHELHHEMRKFHDYLFDTKRYPLVNTRDYGGFPVESGELRRLRYDYATPKHDKRKLQFLDTLFKCVVHNDDFRRAHMKEIGDFDVLFKSMRNLRKISGVRKKPWNIFMNELNAAWKNGTSQGVPLWRALKMINELLEEEMFPVRPDELEIDPDNERVYEAGDFGFAEYANREIKGYPQGEGKCRSRS